MTRTARAASEEAGRGPVRAAGRPATAGRDMSGPVRAAAAAWPCGAAASRDLAGPADSKAPSEPPRPVRNSGKRPGHDRVGRDSSAFRDAVDGAALRPRMPINAESGRVPSRREARAGRRLSRSDGD